VAKSSSAPASSTSGASGTSAAVYRIALLSNAMHQDSYARAFARHPRLRIVAVIDEPGQERYVADRNRAVAAQYGVPYTESLDALADPEIDAVSVGAQIERRARLAIAAAGQGKHLWLDKPPAPNAADAAAVAAAVERAGVTALVFSHVAAPWAMALRRAVASGRLGDVAALHLDFHFAKGDARGLEGRRVPSGVGPRDQWTFRDPDAATDPTESTHNVIAKREIAEVGWYPLAHAHVLCPQLVRRVFATAGAYFFPEHRDLGLEDFATLTLTLDGGTVVTISTGRTGRRSHAGGGRMAVRAVGTRETVVLDGGQPAVLVIGGEGAPESPRSRVPAWGDATGFDALTDHFVSCLDGTASPVLTAGAAAHLVAVLDAAYESARRGVPVDVALDVAPPKSGN
jgi:predicted dehydrogenase